MPSTTNSPLSHFSSPELEEALSRNNTGKNAPGPQLYLVCRSSNAFLEAVERKLFAPVWPSIASGARVHAARPHMWREKLVSEGRGPGVDEGIH
eukprot:CAMPEP_0181338914 /NCGR_PEP_ID=MMETSP1101-20121128/28922_1 /TAXON_ID=46948 /ORGANISM="Rhodomonas abbreviata, Strain Caron Lab Isolate" /LENGTH=93 /DNA_ID=CAMNT_0023449739 /DNA_START=314 /DNA_END=592 /DNA_ORIENTATION=+